jgi:hypothetical protein
MSSGQRHSKSDNGAGGRSAEAAAGAPDLAGLGERLEQLSARIAALECTDAAESLPARVARIEAALAGDGPGTADPASDGAGDELRRVSQELRLVAGERDALLNELNRIDAMQTDTIALDDPAALEGVAPERDAPATARAARDTEPSTDGQQALPSIDELIALNEGDGPWERAGPPAEADNDEPGGSTGWHELLPADMIVAQAPAESARRKFAEQSRWRLVRTDVEPAEEFALDEPLVTVGRSPSADIQVDTDYISRIHARLLRIDATILVEDAGSKNGVRINGERVERWPLKHGDVLQIGAVPFRFVDLDAGD